VDVKAKQVERAAEALGQEIAEDERQCVEPLSETPVPATLDRGMDGTGIPMRCSELVGRSGKQEDGSAKTREVKLVTVWSAESQDENGIPIRDQGSVSYSAAIESAATLDTDSHPAEFTQRKNQQRMRYAEFHAQVSALPREWLGLAVKLPSVLASSARACTGAYPGPTP
jgi:hypothetical protein